MAGLTVKQVVDQLGYGDSSDLVIGDSPSLPASRRHVWASAQSRLGVDAAFFEGRLPVVYFSGLSIPGEREVDEAIARLHRGAWSESRAQLVVVVLPTEVRVLDVRVSPNPDVNPVARGRLGSAALEPFTHDNLLRGRAADLLPSRAKRSSVVDRLRSDLRPTRRLLSDRGLTEEVADQLLARCLFARYLEARSLIEGPGGEGPTFIETLNASVEATYRLFGSLRARFNGDTFTVSSEERRSVRREHLGVVADLLSGAGTQGQLTFLERYDFSTIPAETLGAVYEEFLAPVRRRSGAYYTPGHLVDAALDELMPAAGLSPHATVLDPACGSGLFLARAYSRLLDSAEHARGRPLTALEMVEVLSGQIFGCDLMEDALRIAALSCYLVLLDRLGVGDHDGDWEFPQLVGHNLAPGDFFENLDRFGDRFDLIATNPPWSTLTEAAKRYLAVTDHPTGSRLPLAHAFYWACTERLAPEGRMAILMPARSLYNQRPGERAFQMAALNQTGLDTILDLSAFRFQLFSDAIAPCALFVVRGSDLRHRDHLTFSAPKPGPSSAATGRITIDGDRIARVPREQLARNPGLLRALVFGDLRDADLVNRLSRRGPTLDGLLGSSEQHWIAGVGFQTVRGGMDMPVLREIPHVAPDAIRQFSVALGPPVETRSFHRTRRPEIYDGPRVVLARGIDSDLRIRAAFLDRPASFSESVLAIRAPEEQEDAAQAVCAFLNSRLARYLLLMTASSWGIERPELKAQDVRVLPMPFLNDANAVARLSSLASAAARADEPTVYLRQIDGLLTSIYRLSPDDRALIDDRLDIQLPAFANPLHPAAYARPTGAQLREYADTLTLALTVALGLKPQVEVQRTNGDIVAAVGLDGAPGDFSTGTTSRVDVLGDVGGTIIVRRPTRTYGERSVTLTKLAERRQVSKAAALHDADEITGELLRAAVRRRRPVV